MRGIMIVLAVMILFGALSEAFEGPPTHAEQKATAENTLEASALAACDREIKRKAQFPETVDYDVLYASKVNADNNAVNLERRFSAANAFGAGARYSARCLVIDDAVTHMIITKR